MPDQLKPHSLVWWRHHSGQPHHWQWQDIIHRGGRSAHGLVPEWQSVSKCWQNKRDDCWLQDILKSKLSPVERLMSTTRHSLVFTSRKTSPCQPTPAPWPWQPSSACIFSVAWRRQTSPQPILTTFFRGTIESFLSNCITFWFGNWESPITRCYRG